MTVARAARVASLLREIVTEILIKDISDPGLGFVTLTEVRCTPDLKEAHCYFSLLGDEEAREKTWKALGRARGRIKALSGPKLSTRSVPQLIFHHDETPARAARISGLLAGTVAPEKDDEEE